MKQELQQIATKIGELEQEKDEHQLVIDTISPLEKTRTCFRLVGGILVKRTVEETLPLVEQNKQGIISLMQQLGTTYKKKEEDLNAFQTQYNVKIKA
ncbi:hypothetical protein HDV03_005346 [Kappamyces sp. JEL0829]|nr:hypothetical protein HDV03_005346 [Kappamyces sp. JEL0829]KAJ3360109.1 hypothetical protein HDU91_004712 [Kappamyces sp. JEL0680]